MLQGPRGMWCRTAGGCYRQGPVPTTHSHSPYDTGCPNPWDLKGTPPANLSHPLPKSLGTGFTPGTAVAFWLRAIAQGGRQGYSGWKRWE